MGLGGLVIERAVQGDDAGCGVDGKEVAGIRGEVVGDGGAVVGIGAKSGNANVITSCGIFSNGVGG